MTNTPRNVVVQFGSFITLYLSISFFLTLIFAIINLNLSDTADTYYEIENAADNVRLGIAMLVVFFPAYIALTRTNHRFARTEGTELTNLSKWLIYLSLLVAGLTLLGTLVTVLYTFLDGDITTRFILKGFAVIAVVGLSFHYYLLEAKGYWLLHESRSLMFAVGFSLVIFMTIAFGLKYIDTPATVREMKIDDQQVQALRQVQYQIDNELMQSSSTVAFAIETIKETIPTAPEGREPYTIEATATGFKLCATFSKDYTDPNFVNMPIQTGSNIKNPDNWNYKSGHYCFERTVRN